MPEAANAVHSTPDAPTNQDARPGDGQADANNRIQELRVSGNLMTLDTGLFCVFQSPGSVPPDAVTGLPGVRISLAPGAAGRPDSVSISTFRPDGWLDGTGALVRVTDGPAQILVTVYQSDRRGAEAAPRLQVLRLSGDSMPAAASPAPVPPPPTVEPDVVAHVQRTGDVGGQFGDWIGQRGSQLWLEGFGVTPHNTIAPEDIEYQGVLGRGWLSPWVEGGKYCGSRGMALPLLGLIVRLKGAAATAFDCTYSATFVDGSEAGPTAEGQPCEAESLAALEAFQIVLHPKVAKSEPRTAARSGKPKSTPKTARR